MSSCIRSSFLCAAAFFFAACTFSENKPQCATAAQCGADQECYHGYCLPRGTTDKSPSSEAGKGGNAPMMSEMPKGGEPGTGTVTNPNMMQDSGARDAGSDAMTSTAMNMMNPTPDRCQSGEQRGCTLDPKSGACGPGKQTCQNGMFGACVPDNTTGPEVCNGNDDDCDGKVDEDPGPECFPDGVPGCNADGSGCKGLCAPGHLACNNGKLGECVNAKTPQTEVCTQSGMTAADENCDGVIDDGCQCKNGDQLTCYHGPDGTAGKGKCKAGMQTCSNGTLGACTGEVQPQAESCANQGADDNCDGTADNVPNLNAKCTVANTMGPCAMGTLQCQAGSADLKCVGPAAGTETCNEMDDDCDGMIDDGFDLQKDPLNCGKCGMACAAGDSCCGGKCVNTQTDDANCGACGAPQCAAGSKCCAGACKAVADGGTCDMPMTCPPCGANEMCCNGKCVNTQTDVNNCMTCGHVCTTGARPGCCGGSCLDLATSDSNCGSCNHACGILDGGTLCHCAMSDAGPACAADLLLCL